MERKEICLKKIIIALGLALALSSAVAVTIPSMVYAEANVYVTQTGKKYHSRTNCRGLNNAKTVTTTSEATAKNSGLTKCKICW